MWPMERLIMAIYIRPLIYIKFSSFSISCFFFKESKMCIYMFNYMSSFIFDIVPIIHLLVKNLKYPNSLMHVG